MNTKQQLLSELNELKKQMELKLKKMKEIESSISENELTERQTIFYNEEEKNNMRSQKNITFEYINIMIRKKILNLYDNQVATAIKIVSKFKENSSLLNCIAIAPTQSGKTGIMCAMIKCFLENYEIDLENIFIITGLSDKDWKQQTKERLPENFHRRIYHREDLKKLAYDMKNKQNVFIMIDEVQIACKENQTIKKTFQEIGLFDKQYMYKNDIKIVEFSATPNGVLYDLLNWPDGTDIVFSKPGSSYVSSYKLLKDGKVRQFKSFNKKHANEEDIKKHIEEIYNTVIGFNEPLYHIFRISSGTYNHDIKKYFQTVFNDCEHRTYEQDGDIDNLNNLLNTKPYKHTLIFIKEKLRCAKSLNKTYLGVVHERYTTNIDYSVIIQGLLGRITGYDYNKKTIIYTDIKSIEFYESLIKSDFKDPSIKWKSNSTKFKNNKNESKGTFNMPELWGFGIKLEDEIDTDRNHLVFDTVKQLKEYIFKHWNKKMRRKEEEEIQTIPETLKENGKNPTVAYLLKRFWGINKSSPYRACITNDNKWCLYWRSSLIKK
jgi:hypothetical protein